MSHAHCPWPCCRTQHHCSTTGITQLGSVAIASVIRRYTVLYGYTVLYARVIRLIRQCCTSVLLYTLYASVIRLIRQGYTPHTPGLYALYASVIGEGASVKRRCFNMGFNISTVLCLLLLLMMTPLLLRVESAAAKGPGGEEPAADEPAAKKEPAPQDETGPDQGRVHIIDVKCPEGCCKADNGICVKCGKFVVVLVTGNLLYFCLVTICSTLVKVLELSSKLSRDGDPTSNKLVESSLREFRL